MRYVCLFLYLIMYIHGAQALPLEQPKPEFSVKEANQQFDKINLQLSVQNLNMMNLTQAVRTLSPLLNGADQCIDDTQKKLTNLDSLIQQATQATGNNKASADLVYLNTERKKQATRQAQCRLFSIRAKEAVSAYQTAIAELKQEETFARGASLWDLTKQLPIFSETIGWLNSEIIQREWTQLGLPEAIFGYSLAAVVLNFLLACAIFIYLRHSRLARHHLRIKSILPTHIALLTIGLCFVEAYIYLLINQESGLSFLTALARLSCFFGLSLISIILLFKFKKVRTFFYWYALNQDYFRHLLIVSLSFYCLTRLENIFTRHHIISHSLSQFNHSLLLLLFLAIVYYMLSYFCQSHRHFSILKHHRQLIQRTCALLLVLCASLDMLGYHTLAMHLTASGFITFVVIFAVFVINQGIRKTYMMVSLDSVLNTKINHFFGYKAGQVYTEFLILKTTLQVVTLASAIYVIGKAWAFASYYVETIYGQFWSGIHLGSVTLYPIRVVVGVFVFCLLYLICRGISTYISRRQQYVEGEETQVALASILTYIGFAIALIAGLLVAGFDFTGLAIVAGALSVGIGLGLQSIVNNFVSGLILLIEKPIKPGDRINVDGVEGSVKKIRVRSTHIITPAREDIIVPNSDLITRRVTNFVYSDRHLSINCQIAVPYGSDVLLVQELLLKAANQHEDVIKSGRNKPNVLFRSFGDSSMIFQVWCLIRDANKKSAVQSDLNFAIEQLFRTHNIDLALTQRDIQLHWAEIESLLKNKLK